MTNCFCGSNISYQDCCQPYHLGKNNPPTAEALMRSRYSAYATKNCAYLLKTTHPLLLKEIDIPELEKNLEEITWTQLVIVDTKLGTASDSTGTVEFKAFYKSDNQLQLLWEKSEFIRKKGVWLYRDGDIIE